MENQPQEEQRPLTPEELAKFEEFKKKRQEHFEKEIPNLKVQKEYEELLTEIDEMYLRRVIVQMKLAQINAPEPTREEKEEQVKERAKAKAEESNPVTSVPDTEPKERKLKTN